MRGEEVKDLDVVIIRVPDGCVVQSYTWEGDVTKGFSVNVFSVEEKPELAGEKVKEMNKLGEVLSELLGMSYVVRDYAGGMEIVLKKRRGVM